MEPVRVGVWGVGVWGEKHARVYAGLERAAFAGVYDHDAGRAAAVVEQYGGRVFERPEDLLAACEAVSIAVPTIAHREAAERAARAGVHALVEKPMAPTVADADAMIAAARRAGTTLQIGQVERFNPVVIASRPHLASPKFIEGHRLALFQPRSLDVDVVFDLMIHDIDLVLDSVKAPVERISAVGVAVLSGNEDIANARIEFADGCVANLTASRVSQDRLRRIRFFQSDSYLSIDLFEKTGDFLRLQRGAASATVGGFAAVSTSFERKTLEPVAGEPLALELEAFLASLRGQGEGAASAEAGRDALRVAADVRDAMKQRSQLWAASANAGS